MTSLSDIAGEDPEDMLKRDGPYAKIVNTRLTINFNSSYNLIPFINLLALMRLKKRNAIRWFIYDPFPSALRRALLKRVIVRSHDTGDLFGSTRKYSG